jgi:bifunctional non-homologous end joining protein LigD
VKAEKVPVQIGERQLVLSNLDKVLYPQTGTTKGEVIDYYTRVAPALLPHVEGRPLTVRRFPNGVDGTTFYEKNAPSHTPEWVRTVRLPSPGSTRSRATVNYLVVEEIATLVYLANLAALELHVPMWRVDAKGRPQAPDLMVTDLDPGPPATIVECARVALRMREVLDADGLTAYPKTSGSKGMQLYVPLDGSAPWQEVHAYARQVAEVMEEEMGEDVVSNMSKSLRGGKVLIDWSQNNAAKTTVAPYSLRARAAPTVSTPLAWAEVEEVARGGDPERVRFLAGQALERLAGQGDLMAPLLEPGAPLPSGGGSTYGEARARGRTRPRVREEGK